MLSTFYLFTVLFRIKRLDPDDSDIFFLKASRVRLRRDKKEDIDKNFEVELSKKIIDFKVELRGEFPDLNNQFEIVSHDLAPLYY